jgi:RNA polymerase-binding transcription factor DksA
MKTAPKRKKHSAAKPAPARGSRAVNAADILGRTPNATSSFGRVPAKWRWHHHVLLSLQSRLLRERGELLRTSAQPLEPHSMDEADSATDEFDHDLAVTQLSAEQDALYEVIGAMERILTGSYGICEETGKAIPAARLRAVPWTRFTREVEERLDNKGIVHRTQVRQASTVRRRGRVWLAPEEEAEEADEKLRAPSKNETLSHVFSPPGRHVPRHKNSQRSPNAARRKGRTK